MTRKNERASREAEQVAQLQTVVASLPLVLLAFDREGTFTQYEGKGLEDAGRKQGELVGRSVFDYFGKVPGAREAVEGALAGRTTTWSGEFGGASVELVLLPVRGANGDVQSVTGVAIDVTQHTRAEAEKREADEMRNRLAAIVESTGDAVWSTDTEGRITAWNRSATRLFGYTAQQALGLNVAMLVPPDNRASDAALSLFGNVDMGDWIAEHETQRLHKDGTRVEVALTTSPIHDSDGKLIGRCAIARDLRAQRKAEAELRSTEEQLRQAQKLEAIGSLAGGIAHDFNNMLSVISSYVAMSLGSLDPETELAKDLQEVARAAERAAGLTSQLLAFSRRQILQPQVLDLGQLVNDVHGMLARVLGEAIRITVAPAAELGKVYADPGQVQQVLLNLVLNARDAMPEGGSLVIETANVFLDDAYAAAHHEVASGPYVMLAVSDTGAGMDADTVARIFEPFFTTKEMGKGTGLGLSMVFGIVKQSGG
ncbi:MAG TPA: PAS domain S-box protein, partial [Polyangiales bacterium]|nr:PAS domain S-box protein [Polyangiales bacterium]